MNLNLFKIIIQFLKCYSILGSIIMTVHCAFLLNGIELIFTDILVGLSLGGYMCLLITSFLLKLCNLYRAFLTHLCLVSCCITIQDNIGFGEFLYMARYFAFIFGIFLILIFIFNGFKENTFSTFEGGCRQN